MIQVHVMLVRVPTASGLQQFNMDRLGVRLNPTRIDTITPITTDAERAQDHLPAPVQSVIRYDDPEHGYRLIYVRNSAEDVTRRRRRELLGSDSDQPDFGAGG